MLFSVGEIHKNNKHICALVSRVMADLSRISGFILGEIYCRAGLRK